MHIKSNVLKINMIPDLNRSREIGPIITILCKLLAKAKQVVIYSANKNDAFGTCI